MQQFVLKLTENQRPIIRLKDWNDFLALLDTGAVFPIWVSKESLLIKMGATLKQKRVVFGGFKEKAYGNLYVLPKFILGELIYPDFHIIACENDRIPAGMILSATMFRNLIYEINEKTKYMTITIPDTESFVRNLVIENSNGIPHVYCNGQ